MKDKGDVPYMDGFERLQGAQRGSVPEDVPPLTVLHYNAKEQFGAEDPVQHDALVRFVERQQPDVASVLSAWWDRDTNSARVNRVLGRLGDLGYQVMKIDENDRSCFPPDHKHPNWLPRHDRTWSVGLVKDGMGTGGVRQMGLRDGFYAEVTHPGTGRKVRAIGKHFTDWPSGFVDYGSGPVWRDNPRLEHVRHLPMNEQGEPDFDILMTDANAVDPKTPAGRLLRALRPLTSLVPADRLRRRDFRSVSTTGEKLAELALRGHDLPRMADGTMAALKERGLRDADPKHRPTIHVGPVPIAPLDHLHFNPRTVRVTNLRVHRELGGSDHWPVVAEVMPVE